MRQTTTGKSIAAFTLAVRKKPRNADEKDALFIPVVAWGKTAELCEKYCGKGSRVLLSGRLDIRNYEDSEGIRRWTTEVIAGEVEFLDKAKSEQRERVRDTPLHEREPEEEL
jgi:single-strand DNA-binding protein